MSLNRRLLLLNCCIALVATFNPASAEDKLLNRDRIVFLGDSLTAGLGLAQDEALPARIQQRLDRAGLSYRAINAGRSGDTSAGGLARIDWYFREQIDLRVLVIGLGSNDAMRGLSLSSLEENLQQLIQLGYSRDNESKIIEVARLQRATTSPAP